MALIISTPIALGIAIYISELAPDWLQTPLVFLTELLAAIPSIVYGLWGIFVLVPVVRQLEVATPDWMKSIPLFTGPPLGVGMLSAALVLAIMIIPFSSSVAREVLKAVPQAQREGAYALGATRWEAIRMALFYARTGIVGAVMLGFGRALGETMAVTMVIGNNPQISWSLYAPQYSMAAVLANEFAEAADDLYLQRPRRNRARALRDYADRQRHLARVHLVDGATAQATVRPRDGAGKGGGVMRDQLSHSPLPRHRRALRARRAHRARAAGAHSVLRGHARHHVAQPRLLHRDAEAGRRDRRRHGQRRHGSLIVVGLGAPLRHPDRDHERHLRLGIRRHPVGSAVRFAADTLNGVPSIVIGVFVYGIAVLPFKAFSALAGGLALGIMMIPLIMRTTEELLLLVPGTLKEGALALGATRARAMFTVVLPAALPGIMTGILLALARIAGETAPLIFTAFNNRFFSTDVRQPISTLTVQVFTYAISPYKDWHRQAWAGALVLVGIVFVVLAAGADRDGADVAHATRKLSRGDTEARKARITRMRFVTHT